VYAPTEDKSVDTQDSFTKN